MAQPALWNGDIRDLEVDAIVSPANLTVPMSTGVAGGGHA
jgi:O-acetyl-ADP-ribose deacetylase (regulator of RNase III)